MVRLSAPLALLLLLPFVSAQPAVTQSASLVHGPTTGLPSTGEPASTNANYSSALASLTATMSSSSMMSSAAASPSASKSAGSATQPLLSYAAGLGIAVAGMLIGGALV